MVVAVQKGLENIKDKLKEKGYEIVTYGEYNYPIDAVVYLENRLEISFIKNNNIPNLTSNIFDADNDNRRYGVLLINATNKTIDDIDYILKKGTYSPLF